MLLEIYERMLEMAKVSAAPTYITMVFFIDEEESNEFWKDPSNKQEQGMLLDEWEPDGAARYKKTLYGMRFAIQFNYKKR